MVEQGQPSPASTISYTSPAAALAANTSTDATSSVAVKRHVGADPRSRAVTTEASARRRMHADGMVSRADAGILGRG
jgi:hypothetical protein